MLVVAVAAWNFNIGFKANGKLTDTMLANIEALAQTEGNPIELPEVVTYCDGHYEDCILGSGYYDGRCWYPESNYVFGWHCRWSGKTYDTCCSFG